MISEQDFEKAIDEVILKNDRFIVLYSGIWSFIKEIRFKSKNYNEIPKIILKLFEKKIGKHKTLFIPSFTGKIFSKKKIINIDKDIDKDNGVISLSALKKKYYRTRHPIHSYLVYGNRSEIKNKKFISSWGKNSLLEFFSKKNARICNLGLPWNKGCAYLHRFEEVYKVPWRFKKKFIAKLFQNRKYLGAYEETKFCSSRIKPLRYDYRPFISHITKSKSFLKSNNPRIKFESVKASCLNKIGKRIFSTNPWIIVKNKKITRDWIRKFKHLEEIDNI